MYSKTCVKRNSKIDKTKILMTNGSLMTVESVAECSPWSFLQHFWPALSDDWSFWERPFYTGFLLFTWIWQQSHKEIKWTDQEMSWL